jgi:hypothetical protein
MRYIQKQPGEIARPADIRRMEPARLAMPTLRLATLGEACLLTMRLRFGPARLPKSS